MDSIRSPRYFVIALLTALVLGGGVSTQGAPTSGDWLLFNCHSIKALEKRIADQDKRIAALEKAMGSGRWDSTPWGK